MKESQHDDNPPSDAMRRLCDQMRARLAPSSAEADFLAHLDRTPNDFTDMLEGIPLTDETGAAN